MKCVYIVGTQHPYQLGQNIEPSMIAKFEQMLYRNIEKHQIVGIAEEMSVDWLKKAGVDGTIAFRISQKLGLPHKNCEADEKTKAALGIVNVFDPRREAFWLKELTASFSTFPVLFVCGSMHGKRFCDLLKRSGLEPKILHRNWPNSPDC